MNGPATKPLFNQKARVSVNCSPCASTEMELGTEIPGRVLDRGTVTPDSNSFKRVVALCFCE